MPESLPGGGEFVGATQNSGGEFTSGSQPTNAGGNVSASPASEPTKGCGPSVLKWCQGSLLGNTVQFPSYDNAPCPGSSKEIPCSAVTIPGVQSVQNAAGAAQAVADWGSGLTRIFNELLSPDFWKGTGLLLVAIGVGSIGVFVWLLRKPENRQAPEVFADVPGRKELKTESEKAGGTGEASEAGEAAEVAEVA